MHKIHFVHEFCLGLISPIHVASVFTKGCFVRQLSRSVSFILNVKVSPMTSALVTRTFVFDGLF